MLICIESWVLLENLYFLNKNLLSQLDYSGMFSCVFMVGKYLVLGKKFGKKQLYQECEGNCFIYETKSKIHRRRGFICDFLGICDKGVSVFALALASLLLQKTFTFSTPLAISLMPPKKEMNHLNPAQPKNFQEEFLKELSSSFTKFYYSHNFVVFLIISSFNCELQLLLSVECFDSFTCFLFRSKDTT